MSNIIYTKVKFGRNLKDKKFISNIDDNEQKAILNTCIEATNNCGLKCVSLNEIGQNVIEDLLARDLLEREFVYESSNQGCATDNDTTIQINNKNHIEIFAKANNIYDAYSKAKEVDKKLCNKLNFAYSDKYGFLTPDIKNVGSGMTVEVKIILPALAKMGALNNLPKANEKLIFDIMCFDRQSGLCSITTSATLGYTEQQICEITQSYIDKIVSLEIDTSKKLAEDIDEIEDKCYRAKAILNNCIKITSAEAYVLLGNILIAINAGVEKLLSKDKVTQALNVIKLYENNFKLLSNKIKEIFKK